MNDLHFYKMQAAGNDFVVINAIEKEFSLEKLVEWTPKLCDRRFGIGGDGLLALSRSRMKKADFEMIYRNADGSDAGMCGNGARCLARFAKVIGGFASKQQFHVKKNVYSAKIFDGGNVAVNFPFRPSVTPVTETYSSMAEQIYKTYPGTEHVVMLPVTGYYMEQEKELVDEGSRLRYHKLFKPAGTNVNFVLPLEDDRISLQTYERGVEDLTLACGTGAIASALTWHHYQQTEEAKNHYTVECKGGDLEVDFSYEPSESRYQNIVLKGKAEFVFEGIIRV